MDQDVASLEFDFDAVFEVDDYLYFYGDVLTDELAERQVAFLVQALHLAPPLKILDLACGFGRHANRLAALGYEVAGIDRSPGFLDIARQEAQARGVSVDYRLGDMRRIDAGASFDRVLLLFTAFGYFSDEENLSVLKNVARALKPGGLFAFDINHRDAALKEFKPFFVVEKEGNLMIDRHTFVPASGRMYNRRIVIRDGIRKDKPFFVRMYSATEIPGLLGQAGLKTLQIYGGWDFEPLTMEARRMMIIAEKPVISEK
jgi:SAM-dependent methyltransferase